MRAIESGDCVIGVVAQAAFESPSLSGVHNAFCTLQPLAFEDGQHTEPNQFPNCGLVWWMLTGDAHRFAKPGRLVSFIVEPASTYSRDDPDKHLWQAQRISVKPCTTELVEILTVPSSGAVPRQNDLVSVVSCTVDHPPCATVLVRWHDNLYGLLRPQFRERNSAGEFSVGFATLPSSALQVSRFPAAQLDSVYDASQRVFEVDVSLDASLRNRSLLCRYELIPAVVYRDITRKAERVRLESDSAILRRVAKDILGWTRKERSDLIRLLAQFEQELTHQHEYTDVESLTSVLHRTQGLLERDGELAGELAAALIDSGCVAKALQDGIRERYEAYVESRTAKTAADIEERLESKRQELAVLARRRDELDASVQRESREKRATLARDLGEQQARHNAEMAMQRAALEDEKSNLDHQRQVVEQLLAAVTERFVNAREEVLKELVTLAPLLNRIGFSTERAGGVDVADTPASSPVALQDFKLRPYVSMSLPDQEITESDFFERFAQHVRDSGYVYKRADLVAFHVSVKVSDLTVLGGVSGTGKSSLPRLYAQALAGDVSAWTSASGWLASIPPGSMLATYSAGSTFWTHVSCHRTPVFTICWSTRTRNIVAKPAIRGCISSVSMK